MNPKDVLAAILRKDSLLKQEEIELICSFFREKKLNKEEPLFTAGNKCKNLVFIVEGILRIFVVDEAGEEVVKNFLLPNDFFADIRVIEKDQASLLHVTSVTECSLLILTKPDSDKLISQLPKWGEMMKVGAMQAMYESFTKLEFLKIGDSADQYRHFVKHFPLLAQQVPLKYIASFLRITQSSLSRIRRQNK